MRNVFLSTDDTDLKRIIIQKKNTLDYRLYNRLYGLKEEKISYMDIQDIQDIYKKSILSILSIHVSQRRNCIL